MSEEITGKEVTSDEIKRMSVKEFRKKGYLQELNRQCLHPLGLALEVIINDETGEESLGGIWDYRDDLEGITFGLNNPEFTDQNRIDSFKKKADFVREEELNRMSERKKRLGFVFEPIPGEENEVKIIR